MNDIDPISDAQINSILREASILNDVLIRDRGIREDYSVIDKNNLANVVSRLAFIELFDITAKKQVSCGLCGKLPCGPDTTMLLATLRAGGEIMLLEGVCNDCRPSTAGQSDLKIHYRNYLQHEKGGFHRLMLIKDGKAIPCEIGE